MKNLCCLMALIISCGLFAQSDKSLTKKKSWHYSGMLQGGFIAGNSGPDYLIQTIQGIEKNKWFVGIGAGIDNYLIPAFPVFAHGQYAFGKQNTKPFVYAQAGPAIPWQKNEWNDKAGENPMYLMKTGWLAETGFGYAFPLGKKVNLLTSIGYSIRQARFDEYQFLFFSGPWFSPDNNPTYYHQELTMNRLVLKAGIQF
jgi:hypothetical protein